MSCNKFFKPANIDGSMNDAQLIAAISDIIDNVKIFILLRVNIGKVGLTDTLDEKAHYLDLAMDFGIKIHMDGIT